MTTSVEVAGRHSERIVLTALELDELSSRVNGPVLRTGDEGWDDAILLWNAMVQKSPAFVVQPTSARDVATAVGFARDRGLALSVKGGGHNIAGTAIAEDGLMLDMSRLNRISVDPPGRRVHAGAGCLLKHVDAATQRHGLATVLGFISETGMAGLTLGGGFGYLTRRFGWTADNLVEVEIVTADGEVRIANREENAELFWAVRGGGGNFGVVTRFSFRLHDIGPTITGGLIAWDAEHADQVLAVYQELTASAPRELTAAAMIRLAPPAPFVPQEWRQRPVAGLLVCHSGKTTTADLAPLESLGEPAFDLVTERPYGAQQSILDAMDRKGMNQYWKTEFLPDLSTEYCDTFCDAALDVASPLSFSVVFHLEGALNERDPDDGAVGNRDAAFASGFSGAWPPGVDGDGIVTAVRKGWDRIRPFSTGGNYVNFQLAEDNARRTASAYGDNYARLEHAKAMYDPDNIFRSNRNISPAASTS